MRYAELKEGRNHPCIVVDVQPEYSGMNDGDESPVFEEIIQFVNKQTGPVLMFVNAETHGVSGDTMDGIKLYWEDSGFDPRNWQRITLEDKGYGYFRSWMDEGGDPALVIKMIRKLYQEKQNDSRMLFGGEDNPNYEEQMKQFVGNGFMPWMLDEPFIVEWTSVAQLKRFSGAYLMGGGRNECLREVELLMNAFNIRYKRIDSLVYGD